VAISTRRPLRIAGLAGLVSALLAVGLLGVTTGTQSAQTLQTQLRQGARVPAAAGHAAPLQAVAQHGAYRLAVTVAPNRASARNAIGLTLTDHGRPVQGALVTIAFSMPSMDMWNAFTLRLAARGDGRYVASEPVVGMPGAWQMRVRASRPGGPAATFTVADRVAS
jgi:hypothetical protein